jgi:hypothetical protein
VNIGRDNKALLVDWIVTIVLFETHGPVHKVAVQVVEAETSKAVFDGLAHLLARMKYVKALAHDEKVLALQLTVRFGDCVAYGLADNCLIVVDVGTVKVTVTGVDGGFYRIRQYFIRLFLE